jgi:hypothetical protein
MIGGRVRKIIKRFARNRDDVLLPNFERVSGFDVEWKLLRRPAKHCLLNLAPLCVAAVNTHPSYSYLDRLRGNSPTVVRVPA